MTPGALPSLWALYQEFRDRLKLRDWDEFLIIAHGVLASERVRHRSRGQLYFEEDFMEADLRRHLDTLAHRIGSPALAIPELKPMRVRELPWWRRVLLRHLLGPLELKEL